MAQLLGGLLSGLILVVAIIFALRSTLKSYKKQFVWVQSLSVRYKWIHKSENPDETIDTFVNANLLNNINLHNPILFNAYEHTLVFAAGANKHYRDPTRMYLCLRREMLATTDSLKKTGALTIACSLSPFSVSDMPSCLYKDKSRPGTYLCYGTSEKNAKGLQVADSLDVYRDLIDYHYQSDNVDFVAISPQWIAIGYPLTDDTYSDVISEIHDVLLTQ